MSEDMVIGSNAIMEHAAEAEIFLKQFANKTRLMVLCSLLARSKGASATRYGGGGGGARCKPRRLDTC